MISQQTNSEYFYRRIFCFCNAEDSLAIIIMTWTGPYFLFFCRGFKLVGPMVIMVYRMLAQDIVRCANNLNCRLLHAQTINK